MVSLSNHSTPPFDKLRVIGIAGWSWFALPWVKPGQSRLNQVNHSIKPSFRLKPESRKSPGKECAGYRGFWIPAFAGTTVAWVAANINKPPHPLMVSRSNHLPPALRQAQGERGGAGLAWYGRGGFVTRPAFNGRKIPENELFRLTGSGARTRAGYKPAPTIQSFTGAGTGKEYPQMLRWFDKLTMSGVRPPCPYIR